LARLRAIGALILLGLLLSPPARGAAAGQIPDMLLGLEQVEGKPAYALAVDKESQRLLVYAFDGQYRQVAQMDCSTGKTPGDKQTVGDGRTPEGVYFCTTFHPDRDLAPLYGSGAYPLDYPHLLDRLAGRNGYAIWLHGTNKPLKSFDSNGCIALRNEDLARLEAFIGINRTPVLIAERLRFVEPQAQARQRGVLEDFIAAWNAAQENGSYQEFLAFYDPEYLPEMAWWRDWLPLRKRLRALGAGWRLQVSSRVLLQQPGVYVALFDQVLTGAAGEAQAAGTRKLFIRPRGVGFCIAGEEHMGLPPQAPPPLLAATQRALQAETAAPAVAAREPSRDARGAPAAALKADAQTAAARGERRPPSPAEAAAEPAGQQEAAITAFVDGWLKAWSSENLQAFGECYAADFRSGTLGKRAYLDSKEQLNRKNARIKVSRGALSIAAAGGTVTVAFPQRYESSSYRAVGIKRLILKQENGKWKIYRETWSKG
jgi:hypothetical protein